MQLLLLHVYVARPYSTAHLCLTLQLLWIFSFTTDRFYIIYYRIVGFDLTENAITWNDQFDSCIKETMFTMCSSAKEEISVWVMSLNMCKVCLLDTEFA